MGERKVWEDDLATKESKTDARGEPEANRSWLLMKEHLILLLVVINLV